MNGPGNTIDKADEAQLLATIDRWVEREVAPRVKEFDHADRWPAEIVEQMKELGLFGATVSPDYGGLGLPATHLRRDRDARVLGVDGDHRHLQLPSDAGARRPEVRHRAAEAPLAAQVRLGRDARRAGADRTRCRHRPAGDPAHGAPRRRRLRDQRHQDLDLQRHRGLVLRAPGQDQPRGAAALFRHEPVHRAQGAGLQGRPQAREAGLQVDRFGRADLRGLPRAGRSPDRRGRRPRLHPGRRRPGARPHQCRRARRRHRRGRVAARHQLFPAAQDLRQADLRAPGDPAQARRHGHARPRRAPADARCRRRLRSRRALRPRGRHGEILLLGGGAGEQHRIRCASTAPTAIPRSTTSSGSIATRRSPASARAPTRCSASSSRANGSSGTPSYERQAARGRARPDPGAVRRRSLRHHVPGRARRRGDQGRGARRRSFAACRPAQARGGRQRILPGLEPRQEERDARHQVGRGPPAVRGAGQDRRLRGQQSARHAAGQARHRLCEPEASQARASSACTSRPMAAPTSARTGRATIS